MPDSEDRTRRAIDDAWSEGYDHGWSAYGLVRGQFHVCGRCWIRTNPGGFVARGDTAQTAA